MAVKAGGSRAQGLTGLWETTKQTKALSRIQSFPGIFRQPACVCLDCLACGIPCVVPLCRPRLPQAVLPISTRDLSVWTTMQISSVLMAAWQLPVSSRVKVTILSVTIKVLVTYLTSSVSCPSPFHHVTLFVVNQETPTLPSGVSPRCRLCQTLLLQCLLSFLLRYLLYEKFSLTI